MNRTGNKIKNIIIAGIAIFMAHQMWGAIVSIGENTNLRTGFGAPLTLGMQAVFGIAMVVLYTMAFQNTLEFYVLWKYSGDQEIQENARKIIRFTIYVKIFASLALRLVFSLLFLMLALIAFFAPGVKTRDDGVYGAAVFMLIVAGFMAFANIRVAAARVRELRGVGPKKEEIEQIEEENE